MKPRIKLTVEEKDKRAYSFWYSTFGEQKEMFIDDLLIKFVEHIRTNGEFAVTEAHVLNMRRVLDPDHRAAINIMEFALFYEKFWCDLHERRKIIKFGVDEPKIEKKFDLKYDVTLLVEKTPDKHNSNFKLGEKLTLDCSEQDARTKAIAPSILGGRGPKNHLVFNKSDHHLNDSIMKIMWSSEGYKMRCIAKSSRLKFKVEKKSYSLLPGMVIQFGCNLIYKVVSTDPIPNLTHSEYEVFPNYVTGHVLDVLVNGLTSKKSESANILAFRETYNKYYSSIIDSAPDTDNCLRLVCVSGSKKGEVIELLVTHFKDNTFEIGKNKKECRIILDDITISSKQCTISWDNSPKMQGWSIHEEVPSAFGTYVYFANDVQLEKGLPSYAHKLQDNMVIAMDEFVFRCKVAEEDRNLSKPKKLDLYVYKQ